MNLRTLLIVAVTLAIGFGLVVAVACTTGTGRPPTSNEDEGPSVIVEAGVYEAIETDGVAWVLISLTPSDVPLNPETTQMWRDYTAEITERVLATLAEDDFTVEQQGDILPWLSGHLAPSGLDKLLASPDVAGVVLNCCLFPQR